MTKQEFQERVSKIAENLTATMYQYKDGNIDIHTFKQIMRHEMAEYPYEWMILSLDLQECFDAFHLEVGELYHVDEVGASAEDHKRFAESFISNAQDWDSSQLCVYGSNSFLIPLIGEENIDYKY